MNHLNKGFLSFFSTAPKGVGKPKGDSKSPKKKKKNVWSESEGSGDDDISDDNLDASYLESVIPRERGPRRQAGMWHSLQGIFCPSLGAEFPRHSSAPFPIKNSHPFPSTMSDFPN